MVDSSLYDFSLLLFIITYSVLVIFLIIQHRKISKVARPFISSLIIYFVLDCLAMISLYRYQILTNFDPDVVSDEITLMLSLYGILVILGPIKLIHYLEKQSQKESFKDKHRITQLEILLFISMIVLFVLGTPDTEMKIPMIWAAAILLLLIIGIQSSFFLFTFLFLSIKSTGVYRKRTLIVFFGYTGQLTVNIISIILQSLILSVEEKFNINGIFLLLRVITMVVMAYGFLQLYGKREK